MSDEKIQAIAEAVAQIAYSLDADPARQYPLAPGQRGARSALTLLKDAGFELPARPAREDRH